MTTNHPTEIFFSYAHEDEELRDELAKHLAMLKREGIVTTWYDREITAGDEWAGKIDEHLNTAQIILLLISVDFLASDYCYDVEMGRAIERHDAGEALVIPIILRPCDWQKSPFAKLQALPKDAKPVALWKNRDEAFTDVSRGIRKAVDTLMNKNVKRDDSIHNFHDGAASVSVIHAVDGAIVTVRQNSLEQNSLEYPADDFKRSLEYPADIFISYARTDKDIVQDLYKMLQEKGHRPRMDVYDIKGGENWLRAIYKAIDESQIFLAILSNSSVTRRGVIQKELKKALDKWEGMLPDDIYIIPVKLDDCPIPELLADIQVIDWEAGKGKDKLLEAIQVGLERRPKG